tara:strand:+ start:7833 stop:8081 length:249 start_codon:yes stop_codon:yes gene_type:complete
MNNTTNTPRKKGRPSFSVNWPENTFSVREVYTSLEGKLSPVSVQLKVNKAVADGKLQKVGTSKQQKMGRPTVIYKKVQVESP